MHVGDITHWARGNGLEVVLIALGTALTGRLAHWVGGRYVGRIERESRNRTVDGMLPSDDLRHLHTIAQATEWMAAGVIYFVGFLFVVSRFNLPLTSLVAPATAIGAAVGFGAQRVVQDLLAGFFVFTERQYAFGDTIQVSPVGQTSGITGTVEEVTLRATRLRTLQGELVIIPNGQINQVVNKSRDWSRILIDVPIGMDQDADAAIAIMRRIAADMAGDAEWQDVLLDGPAVAGVESIQAGYLQVRVTARTLPTKQVDVGRELRRRIAEGLREAGIVSTGALG